MLTNWTSSLLDTKGNYFKLISYNIELHILESIQHGITVVRGWSEQIKIYISLRIMTQNGGQLKQSTSLLTGTNSSKGINLNLNNFIKRFNTIYDTSIREKCISHVFSFNSFYTRVLRNFPFQQLLPCKHDAALGFNREREWEKERGRVERKREGWWREWEREGRESERGRERQRGEEEEEEVERRNWIAPLSLRQIGSKILT